MDTELKRLAFWTIVATIVAFILLPDVIAGARSSDDFFSNDFVRTVWITSFPATFLWALPKKGGYPTTEKLFIQILGIVFVLQAVTFMAVATLLYIIVYSFDTHTWAY